MDVDEDEDEHHEERRTKNGNKVPTRRTRPHQTYPQTRNENSPNITNPPIHPHRIKQIRPSRLKLNDIQRTTRHRMQRHALPQIMHALRSQSRPLCMLLLLLLLLLGKIG